MEEKIVQQIIDLVASGGEAGAWVLAAHITVGPVVNLLATGVVMFVLYKVVRTIADAVLHHSEAIKICRFIADKTGTKHLGMEGEFIEWSKLRSNVVKKYGGEER